MSISSSSKSEPHRRARRSDEKRNFEPFLEEYLDAMGAHIST